MIGSVGQILEQRETHKMNPLVCPAFGFRALLSLWRTEEELERSGGIAELRGSDSVLGAAKTLWVEH